MTFQRENRYIVIKRKDLDLPQEESLLHLISGNHIPTRECLVIESDWPEYEPAWRMIQARVEGATLSPAHVEDEREACERWIRQQIGMPARIPMDWDGPFNRYTWAAWSARAALSAPSCPCQTDTARETRRKDGIEAAELQGILLRDHQDCRPLDAGLMGWAAAALSAPPAAGVPEGWKSIALYAHQLADMVLKGDAPHCAQRAAAALIAMLTTPTPPASEEAEELERLRDALDRIARIPGDSVDYHPSHMSRIARAAVGLFSTTPPASEQQQDAVLPEGWVLVERGVWTEDQVNEAAKSLSLVMDVPGITARDLAMVAMDAAQCRTPDVTLDELLRLNPHLAKGEGV
ncbi:hypothetical protein GO594_25670 [Pseudomonas otitidis]|uniref:Uncharacterized protein n=1 Tax=Metapseudomonas otitidis TaxID=319939 RepID=A0A7X3KW76_9GAMM|nr:hypothetical protein [Pseudomonas otitidis]MWK59391.1 hypothetical protein [Pseudomonas otitidis]